MDPGKIHRHISRPARTCAQPRGGKISRPRDSRNFAVAEGIKVAPILRSFLQGEKRQGFVKCVKRDVCFLPEDTLRLPESIRSIDKWWLRVVVFETDARGDERDGEGVSMERDGIFFHPLLFRNKKRYSAIVIKICCLFCLNFFFITLFK